MVLVGCVVAAGFGGQSANAATPNQAPIADAGLSRYVAQDPIALDGTGSYDPDNSGTLSYIWRQISGPAVVITDPNTATPTIGGFVQTDEIQECEFELVVTGDGELESLPDIVKVIIVPDFGLRTLQQENPPFDRNKPTVVYFAGGDCVTGRSGRVWSASAWSSRANIISFPNGYGPDRGADPPTYYRYGDVIIVYLSAVALDYKQPIQTLGYSTGGMPAIDVAIHLNLAYADARYAVNRVTFLDAACRGDTGYSADVTDVTEYLGSAVDGEQCWIDSYESGQFFYPSVLNVQVARGDHNVPRQWYQDSLANPQKNQFNGGLVAGAYWSVVGPGKNLQLASTPGTAIYEFEWQGGTSSGYMDFYWETRSPGRLPEPVTLVGPADGSVVDSNGAVLSCEVSGNAVGYQLLFGRDPYHMVYLFSDTPSAPGEPVTGFPFEQCWWTVRAYDEYGSTIHADPVDIKAESVTAQTIENATTGQTYASIQQAINDAHPRDEIVVSPGVCQYIENVNFKGKSLTLRSTDSNDPDTVAATVINGGPRGSVITMSDSQDGGCILSGLTITGGAVGISCYGTSPTIRNCIVESNGPNAIEFWEGCEPPTVIDCAISGHVAEVDDPTLIAHWPLDEVQGVIAYNDAADCDGTLMGNPVWQPDGGMLIGALQFDGIDDYVSTEFALNPADGPFSVVAWVKGGAPGQDVVSQANRASWLGADSTEGNLMTNLRSGRSSTPLLSETCITDGNWHRIGFVWDGSYRHLYVDGVEVAVDGSPLSGLASAEGGLYFGAGSTLTPGTFFSGLIDDVRIYNRVVRP
ncbi:MAG: hypothetical protein AMJ65_10330 [Phycisphaerae bacterium SG8_4]|nr:MAG: hypothetical protein AMJ65_10330 [Phycisphaerae bacterium SG8_4]